MFCEEQNGKESSDCACHWTGSPQWYSCYCKGKSVCLVLSFREICVSLGLFLKTPVDYLPDLCFPVLPQPLITEKMDVNGLSASKMGIGGVLAGSDVRL